MKTLFSLVSAFAFTAMASTSLMAVTLTDDIPEIGASTAEGVKTSENVAQSKNLSCLPHITISRMGDDIIDDIPEIEMSALEGFKKIENVAQYKNADWSQAVGIARGVTLFKAKNIADSNPDITFFFYTKGGQMVLETTDGSYRVFLTGDAVFFSGKPWWGSAPGLADGYIKDDLDS